MTQADFTVANQTFPNTRTEINTSLQALATNSAGNSAPSTTFPSQWHFDSDGNILYMRNKDNDAWVSILTIGATSDKLESLGATGRFNISTGETVFNESSADIDFRVESNGKTHAIFVDAGNDHVNINTSDDLGGDLNVDGGIVVQNGSNLDQLSLISTDADANQGPNIRMYRNSSSPADDDTLGVVEFEGRNSASQDVIYSQIRTLSADVTDGEEDGTMDIKVMNAGSLNLVASFKGPETVINDASIDHDFRVESNGNQHMIFVDGGSNHVNIGTATDLGGVLNVNGNIFGDGFVQDVGGTEIGRMSSSGNNMIYRSSVSDGDLLLQVNAGGAFISGMKLDASAAGLGIFNSGITTGGEDTPDVNAGGITLDQNANDGNILTFKSSDIAHGMTDNGETDTYFFIKKGSATAGGVYIQGFSEEDQAVRITGAVTTVSTGEATNQSPAVKVEGSKKSGDSIGAMGADDNVFGITNHGSQVVLFKGDGEIFSDQSATVGTYDAYEDAQLVRAFDLNHMQGVINSKFDKFVQYNKDDLQKARLIGTDENGNATSFVSLTGMQRLHNGAIWQQYEKTERLTQAMYKLAIKTLGKEEADKLLDEEEIKLLN